MWRLLVRPDYSDRCCGLHAWSGLVSQKDAFRRSAPNEFTPTTRARNAPLVELATPALLTLLGAIAAFAR